LLFLNLFFSETSNRHSLKHLLIDFSLIFCRFLFLRHLFFSLVFFFRVGFLPFYFILL
jgi:hypothetical protein